MKKQKKVSVKLAKSMEEILTRDGINHTCKFIEQENCYQFSVECTHNDWQHAYEDAVALREQKEKKSIFPIVSAYTAQNPSRLKKIGLEGKAFLVSEKDSKKIAL